MESKIKYWIAAFRLRTLPLSLSCISMGAFIALLRGKFDMTVYVLSLITTVALQILSNLANDYGDAVFGADNDTRTGPVRMVQEGKISKAAMKKMILVFALLSFVSGLALLFFAHLPASSFWFLLATGIVAIIAAVNYTIGLKKPYGYKGLGDISVFIFFGLVAVLGSYFLHTKDLDWQVLLPAFTCGFFATAVLNINNIRDIQSDRLAGKISIPVRIGMKKALVYHAFLLFGGFFLTVIFIYLNYKSPFQYLVVLALPLLIKNYTGVAKHAGEAQKLDPYLKQMAITTLIFVLLFGAGIILSK